jgi:hypothetical protein
MEIYILIEWVLPCAIISMVHFWQHAPVQFQFEVVWDFSKSYAPDGWNQGPMETLWTLVGLFLAGSRTRSPGRCGSIPSHEGFGVMTSEDVSFLPHSYEVCISGK